MSDPDAAGGGPRLPAAAFEITELRRALDAAALPARVARASFVAFGILTIALLGTLLLFGLGGGTRSGVLPLVALGVVGIGVLLALFVVLPFQLAVRARRRRIDTAAASAEAAMTALRSHLASIGYVLPADTAMSWLRSPESGAIIPLVHDSVIAARWWRPGQGDGRVFVEPFLRQGGSDFTLPVLPPV